MKSLSKVLKFVDVRHEQPLRLGEFQKGIRDNTDDNFYMKIKLPRQRFQEDETRILTEDALKRANSTIESAKKEAEKIIQEAVNVKAKIEQEAFDKGFKDGYNKGSEKAQQKHETEWRDVLTQFYQLRKDLVEQNGQYRIYLEQECLKLSFYVAEKILGYKIKVDPESFLRLIEQGMEKVGEEKDILLRVSEADYKKIDLPEIMSRIKSGIKKINILKDPTLSAGDLIINGGYFEIDAGIHARVENIISELIELDVLKDV
jgi:flagellar assembly protein FliH